MKRAAARLSCAGLILLTGASRSQSPFVEIDGRPLCDACGLRVERVATLGRSGAVTPTKDSRVAVDHDGRFVVVVAPGPQIVVYDDRGVVSERLEWTPRSSDSSRHPVVPYANYFGGIDVLDGDRVTSFFPTRSIKLGEMVLPEAYATLIPSRPGGVFIGITAPAVPSGPVAVDVVLGTPKYNDRARVQPRILGDSGGSNPLCQACTRHLGAPAMEYTKSYLWVAAADRYAVSLYRGWGTTLVQTLVVRDSPWFKSSTAGAMAPRLTALRQDWTDVLWVAGLVGDSARPTTVVDVIGYDAPRGGNYDRFIRSGGIVARARIDGHLHLIAPGYGYMNRQLAGGEWVVDVYRLDRVSS